MMRAGDRVTLHIEKAVAGGRTLARHDGAIVLVAAAIPGETVEAEIENVQRGTMWAMTRRVLEASPDRVEPFCDWACGGTAYAHVRYERQCELKRDILHDAFRRIAHVALDHDPPMAPSPPYGYRMRARLHVRDGRLGFFREGTHDLCDAAVTRQLLPHTTDALRGLESALRAAPRGGVAEIEVSENRDATERACHLELAPGGDPSLLAGVTKTDGLTGASCGSSHHARALTLWGSPTVSETIGSVRLERHANAFFQGNRYLLEQLVSRVVMAVPPGRVVELYAGVGLFSAAIAARGEAEVIAVEGDPVSANDLKRNVAPFGSRVRPRHQGVETFLSSNRALTRGATALVDPPRTGLSKEALEGMVMFAPPRIVYVSCDVATLARDTRALIARDYALTRIEAFDMFPNTAHVETLTIFDKVK
jgi:23S rRNA (uracil1939-C5)-methyltransferase